MGRGHRVDGPGVWHHIGHKASGGRIAFRGDEDMAHMWQLFSELEVGFGLEVHALTLLDTHLHALVRSRDGRLSEAMQWLFSVYTKAHNQRHETDGALFRGRFWSEPLASTAAIARVAQYIHENVLDIAGIGDPAAYRWSTCRLHASPKREERWVRRLGVAYALRVDRRLATSTPKRPSVLLRTNPPRVPKRTLERALRRHQGSPDPFVSLDFRTGMFRANRTGGGFRQPVSPPGSEAAQT